MNHCAPVLIGGGGGYGYGYGDKRWRESIVHTRTRFDIVRSPGSAGNSTASVVRETTMQNESWFYKATEATNLHEKHITQKPALNERISCSHSNISTAAQTQQVARIEKLERLISVSLAN